MDPGSFAIEQRPHLVSAGSGVARYWAFVPPPLPPVIGWTEELISALSAADRALGRLAGVGRTLPNPHLLIGPFKRREAVLSSRIEGTQASLTDLVLFEARPDGGRPVGDVLEVANYVRALEHGLVRQREIPMSKRLILELHKILMTGVRGDHLTPGKFRTSQNWIGPPGCSLDGATFVPAPVDRLLDGMSDLERFLHQPSLLPPAVRLSMVHYQFEAIHPFLDGNGRIGRLLITLLLCIEGVLPDPLLYLSAYFEKHRAEYYERLLGVSQRGEWEQWILFFLRGVSEQGMDAVDRASRLVDLRADFQTRLVSARSSSLLLKLVDALFDLPAVTVASAQAVMGVTARSAGISIGKLVDAGILREVTGQARNRVWIADEIRRCIES